MLKYLVFVSVAFAADSGLPEKATAILSKNCYSCHGSAAMAGLRLDQAGDLSDGIVVPGKPEESRLLMMMTASLTHFTHRPSSRLWTISWILVAFGIFGGL